MFYVRMLQSKCNASKTKTFREAFECHGKHDSFLIDGNFSCYWDLTEHCTLCMRNSIKFDKSNMKGDPTDQSIMFGSSIFEKTIWTVCNNYLGVKLSTIFFDLAKQNRDNVRRKTIPRAGSTYGI